MEGLVNPRDPMGHYAALGLGPEADGDDVRGAFLRRAKKYHPDLNRSPEATAIFQRIQLAHDILSDPAARCAYDESSSSVSSLGQATSQRPKASLFDVGLSVLAAVPRLLSAAFGLFILTAIVVGIFGPKTPGPGASSPSDLLEGVGSGPASASDRHELKAVGFYRITASSLRCHVVPDTHSETLTSIPQGTEVSVSRVSGRWARVQWNGYDCWATGGGLQLVRETIQ